MSFGGSVKRVAVILSPQLALQLPDRLRQGHEKCSMDSSCTCTFVLTRFVLLTQVAATRRPRSAALIDDLGTSSNKHWLSAKSVTRQSAFFMNQPRTLTHALARRQEIREEQQKETAAEKRYWP